MPASPSACRPLSLVSVALLIAVLAGCSKPAPAPSAADAAPTSAAPMTAESKVPDLGSESRWTKAADGKVLVTPDNFIRAESDVYMAAQQKDGAFGQFKHTREVAPVDRQLVVRLNRDTIYSSAVFDLDAGPVTIGMPDAGKHFMSILVINEDHYNPFVIYDAGEHTLTRENVGTRYAMVGVRTFVDPADPEDMKRAQALQDGLTFSQPGGPGTFEVPQWDPASQAKVRKALIALSETLPDLRYAAGPDAASVDPVRRIAAAASGWGLNPDKDAIYLNVYPEKNDGKTVHGISVGEVPVEGFWSISVYDKDGYYKPNSLNAYTINSLTGKKADDGTVRVQFGGCTAETVNCLPITDGWNYMVRLYRPGPSILDGSWSFPVAAVVN